MTRADSVHSTPPIDAPISPSDTTNDTAAASAPSKADRRALEAYASWLHMERRLLCLELYSEMGAAADKVVFAGNAGFDWHFNGRGVLAWNEGPQPSSRAEAVLDLAGVDWRTDEVKVAPAPTKPQDIDSELQRALDDMLTHKAIAVLHREFGDDADGRGDYLDLVGKRNACIATLVTVPALSPAGLRAKARALRACEMIEDDAQHLQIAVSLADDLVALGRNAI